MKKKNSQKSTNKSRTIKIADGKVSKGNAVAFACDAPRVLLVLCFCILLLFTIKMALDSHLVNDHLEPSSKLSQLVKSNHFRSGSYNLSDYSHAAQSVSEFVSEISKDVSSFVATVEQGTHLSLPNFQHSKSGVDKSCELRFSSSCQLEPRLIKYWDETTDCFVSPLKKKSGVYDILPTNNRAR